MTDNMKKFLEEASKEKALSEKLSKTETPEAVIALAKKMGFTLTAEDLKAEETWSEISDDEMAAVVGGKWCTCVLGGGGEATNYGEKTCACVGGGGGETLSGECRCACVVGGHGDACYIAHGDGEDAPDWVQW